MGGSVQLRLLLDTHVWLWSLVQPERLGPLAHAALRDPANELWLSPVSAWEAMLLVERGRVPANGEPARWVRTALREISTRDAPLTREVAILSREIPLGREDPADRFIAASAIVHDLTLATADEALLTCEPVPTLAAGQ